MQNVPKVQGSVAVHKNRLKWSNIFIKDQILSYLYSTIIVYNSKPILNYDVTSSKFLHFMNNLKSNFEDSEHSNFKALATTSIVKLMFQACILGKSLNFITFHIKLYIFHKT